MFCLQLQVLLQPSTVTRAHPFVNTSPAPLRWCCGPEPADPLQLQSRGTIARVRLRVAAGGSATIYERLFCYAFVRTGAGFRPAHRVPALDVSPASTCAPSASVGIMAYFLLDCDFLSFVLVYICVFSLALRATWAGSWIHAPGREDISALTH